MLSYYPNKEGIHVCSFVYSGADAPASMALEDTVSGIGCVGRDTVQNTGTDLIFLSHMGLKSFGRTIQEKSMPINNLSGTITKDIIALIVSETEFFKSAYFPEENFYLLTFTGFNKGICRQNNLISEDLCSIPPESFKTKDLPALNRVNSLKPFLSNVACPK